jgi:hypothetical protein
MELNALEFLKAWDIWPRRLVQVTSRVNKDVTALLRCLVRLQVSGLNFPFTLNLIPRSSSNDMRRVDELS